MLQILMALIENSPRELPLFAYSTLEILCVIPGCRSLKLSAVAVSVLETFNRHIRSSFLSADKILWQKYLEALHLFASFASIRRGSRLDTEEARLRRQIGLKAILSFVQVDRQTLPLGDHVHIILPIILENLWASSLERDFDLDEIATAMADLQSTSGEMPSSNHTNPSAGDQETRKVDSLAVRCLEQMVISSDELEIRMVVEETFQHLKSCLKESLASLLNGNKTEELDVKRGLWIFGLVTENVSIQQRCTVLHITLQALSDAAERNENFSLQMTLNAVVSFLVHSTTGQMPEQVVSTRRSSRESHDRTRDTGEASPTSSSRTRSTKHMFCLTPSNIEELDESSNVLPVHLLKTALD